MSSLELKQRLAAILAADAAGYSRLMAGDDRATVVALDAARAIFRRQIEANQGRVIDMAGDSVLAVFETATGAVNAALSVQQEIAAVDAGVAEDRRMRFRIGVHLGDVIEKADGTVYGDGVNIAARLQSLAQAGGISLSDAIHGAVRGKIAAHFEDQGEQQVKNIAYAVRAYSVRTLDPVPAAVAPANAPVPHAGAAIMAGILTESGLTAALAAASSSDPMRAVRGLVSEKVALLDGRIFKSGVGTTLAEFPSALNALRCTAEIRSAMAGTLASDAESEAMRFGLHVGDVLERGDELIGDGIAIALALAQAAEPETVLVSGAFFDQVQRNSPYNFDDLGLRDIGGILQDVRAYRVRGEIGAYRMQSAPTQLRGERGKRPSSIAVLPFRVSGNDEDQRFLADGITDELIVELGRFRRLFVISRSASFALSESTLDPVAIGTALGVRHVLEGQIRKIAGHVRIGLTLSETETGTVVWSDKITRPFEEMVSLLDDITAKIAATVFGRVEDASMVATRRKLPENMTAFECLLRGMAHHRLGGVTDDHIREAVKWFDKAIEADPDYSAAHAWRVCSASGLPDFDVAAGELSIRRALELDPNDAEGYRIMASFELWNENHERAAALIRKAMELNPTDAYLKARCAGIFSYTGEAQLSLVMLDEAESLDPFLPVWCIEERGVALYALERYEEVLQAHGKLAFQTWRSRLYRAAALVALNRPQEARKLVKEAIVGRPGMTASDFMFSERYQDTGKRRELRQRLEKVGLPK